MGVSDVRGMHYFERMTNTATLTPESIETLRSSVRGPVFVRGDDGLADEVAAFNALIHHDPDVVVGVTTEADVAAAVRFAAANGLAVRIQATGHGAESPITSGMIISTQRLDSLTVDPDTRTATIGAGLRWRPVIDAAAAHGLAPITGSSVSVGAVGYSLGGGLGPLVRSHGLSSDWVRGFRIVTATGEAVTADAHSNPELFWALRGGKGGLGVVTEMTIELVPLPALYAGGLFFDGAHDIETALRAWVDWLPDAPEEVSTSVALLRMPDLEFIPAPIRGRNLLNLRFAYPGDADEGARLIAPLRAAATVYIDAVGPMELHDVGTIHNDPEEGGPGWTFAAGLAGIDHDFDTELLERLGPSSDSPFVSVELRHLGGAAARDVTESSAAGGRDTALMLNLVAADPRNFAVAPAQAEAVVSAKATRLAATTNVNFGGDLARIGALEHAWPPETATRLATVRDAWDPDDVFAFGPDGR